MPDALIKAKAKPFYTELLEQLNSRGVPYLVAGTFAFSQYTGIIRQTKDLDLFCKAGDYPRILKFLADKGFKTEVTDERWLGKAKYNGYFADVIWGVVNGLWTVDDSWFEHAPIETILGVKTKLIPPEELIWTKIFRNDRNRSDIADVTHVILKKGKDFDWKRLILRMEQQWEVFLSTLLMYRFIYPAERDIIPKWLMEELMNRLKYQLTMPTPKEKVCRGQIFSSHDYEIDIKEWNYYNIVYGATAKNTNK